MTNLKQKVFATLGLAGAVAASTTFSLFGTEATPTGAYSTLGHNLSIFQRDFRVRNDFEDTQSNNNTAPHVNFPGATGAVMAIWKGAAEWGSGGHGDGSGDPVSGNFIGSGGANFDYMYQGTTSSLGSFTNIVRTLDGFSGSTLAFMQGGGSGWHIRFYDGYTWQDGPGSAGSGSDIQAVACHELGHALGLGHSSDFNATMYSSISGSSTKERSLNSDDINGVRAIYGVADPIKPNIGGISGTLELGSALTITGVNFSATNNEVWFTKLSSDGVPAKVFGVPSNGSELTVTIPANAIDGEVMVRRNATGHLSLSDAYPINIDEGGGQPPFITDVTPASGPTVGWTEVTLTGIGFTGTSQVLFGGVDARSFQVVNDGTITAVSPQGVFGETVTVSVVDDDGTANMASAFNYGFNQFMDIEAIDPVSGPLTGGQLVTITGPNVVPAYSATFDGVAGTNLEIASATEFTVETPAGAASGPVDVFVQGSGNETLVDAYEYESNGSFVDIGPGLGSAFGTPGFTGTGDLTPGGTGFTLNVTSVAPNAVGGWFIGLTEGAAGFKGGTLYPIPFLVLVDVVADPSGSLTIPAAVDVSTPPGISVVMQMWFQDGTAPNGFSGTNGLRADIP